MLYLNFHIVRLKMFAPSKSLPKSSEPFVGVRDQPNHRRIGHCSILPDRSVKRRLASPPRSLSENPARSRDKRNGTGT